MKTKIIIALLCFAIPAQTYKARAGFLPLVGFCIAAAIGGTIAVGVKIYAQRCATHPYCWRDPETGEQYCRNLTHRAAQAQGTNIVSGPFPNGGACDQNCATNKPAGTAYSASAPAGQATGAEYPARLTVQKSLNRIIWFDVATATMNPDLDSQEVYEDTEPMAVTAFYRFRY